MRLIDADALVYSRVRIAHEDGTIGGYNAVVMSSEIKHAPTIDAVPVIRCKDCKHWYEKYRHGVDMSACKRSIGYFGANDYCSRAERKEE